ncbi:MAG: isoamylase early set domain-containing protein [Candidatus Omnitrophota bacterium]
MARRKMTEKSCMSQTAKKECVKADPKKIRFIYSAPEANAVLLGGDFNEWDYSRNPMKKGRDNVWKTDISLKPGRYEYKFVVDGNWVLDPNSRYNVMNPMGVENSVIEL